MTIERQTAELGLSPPTLEYALLVRRRRIWPRLRPHAWIGVVILIGNLMVFASPADATLRRWAAMYDGLYLVMLCVHFGRSRQQATLRK